MNTGATVSFFGSSLVSTYWNGAATYYRGILEVLSRQGFTIYFYEPDILNRQKNRDIEDPEYATVIVYQPVYAQLMDCLETALSSDIVIKASGVGVFDEQIEIFLLTNRKSGQRVFFWDVDAPATLERIRSNQEDYFRRLIPGFDHILTYGGGQRVIDSYKNLGARQVTPIYNAYSPETHFPAQPDSFFEADLAFLGNRLPDRENRADEFFFKVAKALPHRKFLLGGSGWADKPIPDNVRYIGHVSSSAHNAFNCSPLAVLNISRDSMAAYGYSPATRVFEAAGAGACIITDAWLGVSFFFEPDKEILVVANAEQLIALLNELTESKAKNIGKRALAKAQNAHTYSHRADEIASIFHTTTVNKTL